MAVNKGRKAHEHALYALSYLLNEPWSFEVLGLVRYELGQAYFLLKKHLKEDKCQCGPGAADLDFFKSLIIDINSAIADSTLSPVPIVVDELQSYFSQRKQSHRCIYFQLKKQSMIYDV